MQEYFFLYAVAFLAVLFAVFQDFRFKEISNWLTFSLISFVLSYRLIYSIFVKDISFFLFGLGGVLLFVVFGYILYYGRVFAGGDAKLLFGLGGIFPYSYLSDYLIYGIGFVVLLLFAGVAYTLFYTLFIAFGNWDIFSKKFSDYFRRYKFLFIFSILCSLIFLLLDTPSFYFFALPLMFIIFVYSKALEGSCMIKLVEPERLTEGDWLVDDVGVGNKIIRKTVHGLSYPDILLLRKHKKKVWIKYGVPFAPAFLIALLLFLFLYDKFLSFILLY